MNADTILKIGLFVAGWLLGLFSKEVQEWIGRWRRGPKLELEFDDSEECVTLSPEARYVENRLRQML